jgi:glucosamine--fructose-6-phosphate aminotransferase (isomerizing)
MCGIVGAVVPLSSSPQMVVDFLLSGLSALEYRGYDSAGMALMTKGKINRCRTQGRVMELVRKSQAESMQGHLGIAHTRWATHGEPSETNAHPHVCGTVAIVHNGIVDNHQAIKADLLAKGFVFHTQTDSEVIAHLLSYYHDQQHLPLPEAVREVANVLEGIYAFVAVSEQAPGSLVGISHGAPLVLGLTDHGYFLASDMGALISITPRTRRLQFDDMTVINASSATIFDRMHQVMDVQERPIKTYEMRAAATSLGEYSHYMQKEIFEQPVAIAESLEFYSPEIDSLVESLDAKLNSAMLGAVEHVLILGCGTSYHAGLTAKYWLESVAKVSTAVEIASEFRYREAVLPKNSLVIAISQSGETADTLSALQYAKSHSPLITMTITNVAHSAIVEQVFAPLLTHAGPEIGVASTKAFTTQLATLALLTIALAKAREVLPYDQAQLLLNQLLQVPSAVREVLRHAPTIAKLAEEFSDSQNALFLGRGIHFPIALEGALKLKEISYIHAEAYPSGELKHGPLALVDKSMPVVAVAPNDQLLQKLLSNLEEVRARGGRLIVFSESPAEHLQTERDRNVVIGENHVGIFSPIVNIVPLQLLAYYIAVLRGTDVDRPRNLAKSVTVE